VSDMPLNGEEGTRGAHDGEEAAHGVQNCEEAAHWVQPCKLPALCHRCESEDHGLPHRRRAKLVETKTGEARLCPNFAQAKFVKRNNDGWPCGLAALWP